MKVTIMIGLPCSGKSTWIRKNMPGATVVSADDYFTRADGEYVFTPSNLGLAHQSCFLKFMKALLEGMEENPDIVVDNCNTQNWERAPYVLAAQAYNADVRFVYLQTSPSTCCGRSNSHRVPADTIWSKSSRREAPVYAWNDIPLTVIKG